MTIIPSNTTIGSAAIGADKRRLPPIGVYVWVQGDIVGFTFSSGFQFSDNANLHPQPLR
jgi:hypothetical protein